MSELKKYYDLSPEQWPKLYFNWDLTFEGQRYALDGVKQEEFAKDYSEGFKLRWVVLKEFDAYLCHFSRRDGLKELWELGNKSSLAQVIHYLSQGSPITPPLVSINDFNHKEFIIIGGHHRYAVAKASNITRIPIYFESKELENIAKLVELKIKKT